MFALSLENRPEITVLPAKREVSVGGVLPVRVTMTVSARVPLAEAMVELVRTETIRYRHGNVYGGAYTAPATRSVTVDRHDLAIKVVTPEHPANSHAVLRVPRGAVGSADGNLVTICWSVMVIVRSASGRVTESRQVVRVLSGAQAAPPAAPALSAHAGFARLELQGMAERRILPGIKVDGELLVVPVEPASVTTVMVALVLCEHVAHGPWDHQDHMNHGAHRDEGEDVDPSRLPANEERDSESVVVESRLAEHLDLVPGEPLTLAFSLPAPARLPAPSASTDDYTIGWQLRFTLSRRLHREARLTLDLHAQTAPAPGKHV